MTLECCGFEYDMERGSPSKFCIIASHTTNPDDVQYFDEDDEEGNANVVTCQENGCTKKRKVTTSSNAKKAPAKKLKR
jgi:sortase (surface protein transpeptidase)